MHENQDTRLAVAANDIEWIKQSLRETRDAIEEIKDVMREQNERADQYATKEDVENIRRDAESLKTWRSWITGVIFTVGTIAGALFEYGRQWPSGARRRRQAHHEGGAGASCLKWHSSTTCFA